MSRRLQGRAVVPGRVEGVALVCREPLSLWGGFNPRTGEIVDRRHAQSGQVATGRVLVLPRTKGSSTGSACLLESIRAGTAPAAIITAEVDAIVALGSIVADELYGRCVPAVALDAESFASLRDGDVIAVAPDGTVTIGEPPC